MPLGRAPLSRHEHASLPFSALLPVSTTAWTYPAPVLHTRAGTGADPPAAAGPLAEGMPTPTPAPAPASPPLQGANGSAHTSKPPPYPGHPPHPTYPAPPYPALTLLHPQPQPQPQPQSTPPAPDTPYPTLVTTTTTTTTTTITTTHHHLQSSSTALFSSLALPGLGLLRSKSGSRPGSAGSPARASPRPSPASPSPSPSPSSPRSAEPVPIPPLAHPNGHRSVSSPTPLAGRGPPSPRRRERPSVDRAVLLSKPLPPSPPSLPSPPPSLPAPRTPLALTTPSPAPTTPAVTLTPSSPPSTSTSTSTSTPSSAYPAFPPFPAYPTQVHPTSAPAYLAQSALALQGLGLPAAALGSPLAGAPPAHTLSPLSAAGTASGAGAGAGPAARQKRFSIRRARSFDRPSASASFAPAAPFHLAASTASTSAQPSHPAGPIAPSSSPTRTAAASAAGAGGGSGSGSGKVHFAPPPEKRPRRPRTATLPVPPHLTVTDLGAVDVGAGGRGAYNPNPNSHSHSHYYQSHHQQNGRRAHAAGEDGCDYGTQLPPLPVFPALPALPALPTAAPAQPQPQEQEKRSFWRRRLSTSRPSSRGKDGPSPSPSVAPPTPPAMPGQEGQGAPPAGSYMERGLAPSPDLGVGWEREREREREKAGGAGGGGGMWEKAARRRASSAFLRFAGMGRESDGERERDQLQREGAKERSGTAMMMPGEQLQLQQQWGAGSWESPRLGRESWEMQDRHGRAGPDGSMAGDAEREGEREDRGRRRASTLLSPVQIRPAHFQPHPPPPLPGGPGLRRGDASPGSSPAGEVLHAVGSASPASGSFVQDSPVAEHPWAPSPSLGAPSPTIATPTSSVAPTPPPRSRSTTLDSLASLASFPWARNSLILSAAPHPPLAPGMGPGSGPEAATPPGPSAPAQAPARRPSLSRMGLLGLGKKAGSVPTGLGSVLHESGSVPSGLGGTAAVLEEDERREREREPRRRRTQEEVERDVELERVVRTVSRAELAEVLCGTPLLALHLARIHPSPFPAPQLYAPGLPIDISLRMLLMHLALPKETQAIDRFVETFASTWAERYPGLVNTDQAYILAFSMIMLHTDHFNPSNKRKMSREDYVRNTRRDGGVPDVVLEYFYDNITFTRFIFVEDAVDVHGQRSFMPAVDISPSGISVSPAVSASAGGGRSKGKKIDVYYLIAQGRLDPLRAPVGAWIPSFEPFSYAGTNEGGADDWVERCNDAFAGAAEVRVDSVAGRSTSGLAGLGNFGSGGGATANGIGTASMTEAQDGGMVLKLTKVGALLRRQVDGDGGRKNSHKWRNLGVALTGSQLLFFKDPNWIVNLKDGADAARRAGNQPPRLAVFRPDDWVSLRDAVALFDTTYLETEHTFRLVLPHKKQYLFQVAGEDEVNEWMALINYAASFKTAGVRMRSAGMTSRQLGLAALAAAESHVREVRSASGASSPAHLSRVVSLDDTPPTASPGELTPVESGTDSATAVSNSPSLPSLPDPADQLEATFREIKAELAAIRPGLAELGLGVPPLAAARKSPSVRAQSLFVGPSAEHASPHQPEMTRSSSLGPLTYSSVNSSGEFSIRKGWLASRSEVIERKIASVEQDIAKLEPHVEADLRAARNLAMLTPFLKSTREKINAAVQPLARRVTQLRMDLARLRCYCDVLRADLDAEQREWASTKQTAFDAAEARLGGGARARGGGLRVDVPRMTLSMHLESPREMLTDPDSTEPDGEGEGEAQQLHRFRFGLGLGSAGLREGRPASTMTADSFPSAGAVDTPGEERTWSPGPGYSTGPGTGTGMDSSSGPGPGPGSGFQSPMSLFRSRSTLGSGSGSFTLGSEGEGAPTPTRGRFSLDTPTPGSAGGEAVPAGPGIGEGSERAGRAPSPAHAGSRDAQPRDGGEAGAPRASPVAVEEEAEEWEKTRAAKRVSLVRIPERGLHPRVPVHSQASSGGAE